jgi:hypothetical protein
MDTYYWIERIDKNVRLYCMSHDEVESEINERATEDCIPTFYAQSGSKPRYLDQMGDNSVLLICGELKVPKAVKKVVKYEIPY